MLITVNLLAPSILDSVRQARKMSRQLRWLNNKRRTNEVYADKCRAEFRAYRVRKISQEPDWDRFRDTKKHYGVSWQERVRLFTAQGGACAICTRLLELRGAKGCAKTTAVLDHCHTTGRVRGVLCGLCNLALGRFGDDPVNLRAAAAYLERSCN